MLLSFSNITFSQNINYSSLYTNSTFNGNINLALPVGSLAGKDASSGNGSANYSVPIAIPIGTNGIQPQLGIQYSSSGGNNFLGWGWMLSGLSNISRGGNDIYHDKKVEGIKFTNEDAFLLDGIRILPTNGANGIPNTVYSTEVETYSAITSYGISGTGPEYFEVKMKDGSIFQYGRSADSKVNDENSNTIVIWRINKMTDVNGNYIEYKYINTDRDFRIDEINYTGNANAGIVPYNKIKFNYLERDDKNVYYENGSKNSSKYLLNNIIISGEGGGLFKQYNFKYGKGDLYSFLMEIEEKGSDNSVINPTKFLYGEINENVTKVSSNDIINKTEDFFSGDFNGDGYSDLIGLNRNIQNNVLIYDKFTLYKSTGTNATPTLTSTSVTPLSSTSFKYKRNEYYSFFKNFTSDFDGDGDDDVLLANFNPSISSPYQLEDLTLYISDNSTSNTAFNNYYVNNSVNISTVYQPPSIPNPPYTCIYDRVASLDNFMFQGDFNGDGKIDVITRLETTSNTCGQLIHPMKSFFTSPFNNEVNLIINNFYLNQYAYPITIEKSLVLDFNGDGKSDILVINQDEAKIFTFVKNNTTNEYDAIMIYSALYPTVWHTILLGDFNGDGKMDLVNKS